MKLLELELTPIELFHLKEIETEQKTFVEVKGQDFWTNICQN